jgi:hypothetical protein
VSSKAEFAFDVAIEAYKNCVECCGYIHAMDPTAFKEHRWKPDRKPRPEDYIADFWLAGHAALEKAGLHSRLVLFDIFYMGNCPYEKARKWFGLSELGWVRWTEDIRRLVGEELIDRGLFPPKAYFGELARKPGKKA